MKELKPYLELNDQIRAQADRQALLIQYGVLAYMCGLWGVLFRLTWWEYSWDIMEPGKRQIAHHLLWLLPSYCTKHYTPRYTKPTTRF